MPIKPIIEKQTSENQAEEALIRLSSTVRLHKQAFYTPVRDKNSWIMDAWQQNEQDYTPQMQSARSVLHSPIKPYNRQTKVFKNISLPKEKGFSTTENQSPAHFQKENKYRTRILTRPNYHKVHKDIEPCSFKTPLNAIQYPLTRVSYKMAHRLQKYRSFIARTMRK